MIAGASVTLVGTSLFAFYYLNWRNQILPKTYLGSLDLGGKTTQEAYALLETETKKFLNQDLSLTINGRKEPLVLSRLGIEYDLVANVRQAYNIGRNRSLLQNLLDQLKSIIGGTKIALAYDWDEEKFQQQLSELSLRHEIPEENARFVLKDGQLDFVPEKQGLRFDHQYLKNSIQTALQTLQWSNLDLVLETAKPQITLEDIKLVRGALAKIIEQDLILKYEKFQHKIDPEQLVDWAVVVRLNNQDLQKGFYSSQPPEVAIDFDQKKIKALVRTLSNDINQEPQDAKLIIQNGRAVVFQAHRPGLTLDYDAATTKIYEHLITRRRTGINATRQQAGNNIIKLPVKKIPAQVTSDTIEALGIKELIGRAETDFSGSPNNRIHNIVNGTKFLNGLLIRPNEEFSTVKALGKVSASTGYLPELVIKNNRTIPEFGGGLCQVSTTLFRAALDAGLKITERRNHSYRVNYYERNIGPGLDATVYLPQPDLKFLNDTPGWILVQGERRGNKLIFELYGTSDGRTSQIKGPYILSTTPAPAPIYEYTDRLAPREVKQLEKPHDGAKTVAHYQVFKDGKLIHKQSFYSSYKALPARFLKGLIPQEQLAREKAEKEKKKQQKAENNNQNESAPENE